MTLIGQTSGLANRFENLVMNGSSFGVRPSLFWGLAWCCLAPPVWSQPAQTGVLPELPAERLVVSRLSHCDELAHYRAYAVPALQGWRESNETVRRIGGWRAYAREARQPDTLQDAPRPAAVNGCGPSARSAP